MISLWISLGEAVLSVETVTTTVPPPPTVAPTQRIQSGVESDPSGTPLESGSETTPSRVYDLRQQVGMLCDDEDAPCLEQYFDTTY